MESIENYPITSPKNCEIESGIITNNEGVFVEIKMKLNSKILDGKKICLVNEVELMNTIGNCLEKEGFGFDTEEGLQSDESYKIQMNKEGTPNSEDKILAEITGTSEFIKNLEHLKSEFKYGSYGELIKDLIREKVANCKLQEKEFEKNRIDMIELNPEHYKLLSYFATRRNISIEKIISEFIEKELKTVQEQIDQVTTLSQ